MIVFLDFDGVLNSEKDTSTYYDCVIYPAKVAILNRIVATLPEVRFVLSTSWRDEYLADRSFDVRALLRANGFRGEFHEDWRTPMSDIIKHDETRMGWLRGDEVLTWLENNGLLGIPYVILDDMPDFHPYQSLVRTNAKVGLTRKDVDKAIEILTGSKKKES